MHERVIVVEMAAPFFSFSYVGSLYSLFLKFASDNVDANLILHLLHKPLSLVWLLSRVLSKGGAQGKHKLLSPITQLLPQLLDFPLRMSVSFNSNNWHTVHNNPYPTSVLLPPMTKILDEIMLM